MLKLGMCRFLESLYTPIGGGVGCLRESPRVESSVCYTNTNYLALHALLVCESSIVEEVRRFIERYDHEFNGRFEVLFGRKILYPPRSVRRVVIDRVNVKDGLIEISADIANPEILPDWREYADLVMIAALERLREGYVDEAEDLRRAALAMWDGAGFKDKAFRASGLYETYKLSLYYFLARAMGVRDSVTARIPRVLEAVTDVTGGIVTHYRKGLEPVGDPNVETTSLTLLALYSSYPERLGSTHRGGDGDRPNEADSANSTLIFRSRHHLPFGFVEGQELEAPRGL